MAGWPDELSYRTDILEAVATFLITDDGPMPKVLKDWAKVCLADVADAAGQVPLFGTHGTVVDEDWQPV